MISIKSERKKHIVTLMLFVVALIWGTGFIATKFAIDANYSSAFIMLVRFSLASILFGIIFRRDVKNINKQDLKGGVFSGITLFMSFLLQTNGLQYTTPANNAFITATNIVFVPFLVWGLYKKRPPVKSFVAAFVCFIGLWGLSFTPGEKLSFGLGDILTLFGAVSFALHTTILGRYAKRMNTRKLNFLQLLVAALLSIMLFIVTDRNLYQFKPQLPLLSVGYLAVFSTCLAYFIQTTAQKYASSSKTAIIISTESLFASILSIILGYDLISSGLIFGGIAILISILIMEIDINFYSLKNKS